MRHEGGHRHLSQLLHGELESDVAAAADILLAEVTVVGPVEHSEASVLTTEADSPHLQVSPALIIQIIIITTLQLSSGLLDSDVTELKQAQSHTLQLITPAHH